MPLDDYYSRRGLNHLSPKMGCIGLSWAWGGMGEIAVINDYNANLIPDSVSDEQGALVEPTAVALYGVDRAKVGGGRTVLITGRRADRRAGGALLPMPSAPPRSSSASRTRTDGATSRGSALRTGSSIRCSEDVIRILRDDTEEGVGVDSAIECSGNEAALNTCVRGRPQSRHRRPGRSAREEGARSIRRCGP